MSLWLALDRWMSILAKPLRRLGSIFLQGYYAQRHMGQAPQAKAGRPFTSYLIQVVIPLGIGIAKDSPMVLRRGMVRTQTLLQIYFTGVQILPIVVILALMIGSGVFQQALTLMPTVGFGSNIAQTIVGLIVREISPVFTALLVAARSGAALTTYIGNMKVDSELDSLETMGVSPRRYIVLPAIVGAVLSLLCLNALFTLISVSGGLATMSFLHLLNEHVAYVNPLLFLAEFFKAISFLDLTLMILKPIVFGLLIGMICSERGLHPRDRNMVPVVTSQGVVRSFLTIILADVVLSAFYIKQYLDKLEGLI